LCFYSNSYIDCAAAKVGLWAFDSKSAKGNVLIRDIKERAEEG